MYKKSELKTLIRSLVSGEIGDTDWNAIFNNAATEMTAETDIRSLKRKRDLEQAVLPIDYQYICPTDLKGQKIIDIAPEENRSKNRTWNLVPVEEFDRLKSEADIENGLITIMTISGTKTLLVSGLQDEDHEIIYYSKLPWQNSTGVWQETSTDDDYLNAEEDEVTVFKYKAAEIAENFLRNWDNAERYKNTYTIKRKEYLAKNPSEALFLTTTYHFI